MSKKKQTAGDAAPDPAADEADAATIAETRTFLVSRPPMVNGHINGLIIKDGVCETTDAIRAHGALEYGCTVIDQATGQPAWPKE